MVKSTKNYKGRIPKLSEAEAKAMLSELEEAKEPRESIAAKYGISYRTLERYMARNKDA